MKNTGLNLEREIAEQSEKDWKFGAASVACIANIPEAERDAYLPDGEVQIGKEDTSDCASRAPVNVLETLFDYFVKNNVLAAENLAWLRNNGYVVNGRVAFSDAFVSINSGTTRDGNSLKAPLEAIRLQGLIPKAMLPLEKWMTFDDYQNPKRITPAMKKLGADFVARFTVNYEQVPNTQVGEVSKTDLVIVAGYAWPKPVNGEYPAAIGFPFNHAFVVYKTPEYNIFDNYLDWNATDTAQVPGDFTKKLSDNYIFFDYGYRVIVSNESVVAEQERNSIIMQILKAIGQALGLIQKEVDSLPKPIPASPSVPPAPVEAPAAPQKKIRVMALAQQAFEGYFAPGENGQYPHGSPAWRNNNPGNIKSASGAFLKFSSYEAGLIYLMDYITRAATGKHPAYPKGGETTLQEYAHIYTNDPEPAPTNYGLAMGRGLGVDSKTYKLKNLLS